MGPDPADIGKARRVSAETYAGDCARRIGSVLHGSWTDAGRVIEISATIGGRRVDMHNRVAAVEFFHNWFKRRIAEPDIVVAGKQTDAVRLQRVISIGNLF